MKTFLTPKLLQSKGITNSTLGALKNVLKPKNTKDIMSALKDLKMPKPISADAFQKTLSGVKSDAFKKTPIAADLLEKIAKDLKK